MHDDVSHSVALLGRGSLARARGPSRLWHSRRSRVRRTAGAAHGWRGARAHGRTGARAHGRTAHGWCAPTTSRHSRPSGRTAHGWCAPTTSRHSRPSGRTAARRTAARHTGALAHGRTAHGARLVCTNNLSTLAAIRAHGWCAPTTPDRAVAGARHVCHQGPWGCSTSAAMAAPSRVHVTCAIRAWLAGPGSQGLARRAWLAGPGSLDGPGPPDGCG